MLEFILLINKSTKFIQSKNKHDIDGKFFGQKIFLMLDQLRILREYWSANIYNGDWIAIN